MNSNMKTILNIQKILAIIAKKNRDFKCANKVPVSSMNDGNRLIIEELEKEFNSIFSAKNTEKILKGELNEDEVEKLNDFLTTSLSKIRSILSESRVPKTDLIKSVETLIRTDNYNNVIPDVNTIMSTYQGIPVFNENGEIGHITMDYHGKNLPKTDLIGRFFNYWIDETKHIQCNNLGFRATIVEYPNCNKIAKFGHISDLKSEEYPNYIPANNSNIQNAIFRSFLENHDVPKETIDIYLSKINVFLPLDDNFDDMENLMKYYSTCFDIPNGKNYSGTGPSIFFDSENNPMPISVDFDNTIAKWQGSSLVEDERSHIVELTEFGKWLLQENNCISFRITTSRSDTCSFTGKALLDKIIKLAKYPELIKGISNPKVVLKGSEPSSFKSKTPVENGCYIHYDDDSSLIASGSIYIVRMNVDESIMPPFYGITETSHNPEPFDILAVILTGNIGSYKSTVAKEILNSSDFKGRHHMWFGNDSSRISTLELAMEIAESTALTSHQPIGLLFDQAEINFKPARKNGDVCIIDKFTTKIQLVHDSILFNLVEVLDRKNHDNLDGTVISYNDSWPPVRHEWDLHRKSIIEVANHFIGLHGRTIGLKLMKDWCFMNMQRLSVSGNFFRITYMEGRPGARKTNDRAFYNARNLVVFIDNKNKSHIVSEGPPLTKEVSIEDEVTDVGEALDNFEMDRRVHPKIMHLSHVVEGHTDFVPLIYDAKADGSTIKMMAIPNIVYKSLVELDTFTKIDRLFSEKILELTNGKWTIWYTSSGSYGLGQIVDKMIIWLYKNFGGNEDELREEASHFNRKCNGLRKIHSEEEIDFMMNVINRKLNTDNSIIDTWSSNIYNFFLTEHGFELESYLFSNENINHITESFEILMKNNTGLFGKDSVLAISSPITQLVWLGTVTTNKPWTRSTHSKFGFAIPYRVNVDSVDKMKELHCYTRLVAEGRMLHEEFTELMPSCNTGGEDLYETNISHEGWMIGFHNSDRIIKGKGKFYFAAHKAWYVSSLLLIKKVIAEADKEQLDRLIEIYPAVNSYITFVNTFTWHSFEGISDIANSLIPDSIFSKDKKPARKESIRSLVKRGETVDAFKKCGKVLNSEIIPNGLAHVLSIDRYREMSRGSKGDRELIGLINHAFMESLSCNIETYERGLKDLRSLLFTIVCRKG